MGSALCITETVALVPSVPVQLDQCGHHQSAAVGVAVRIGCQTFEHHLGVVESTHCGEGLREMQLDGPPVHREFWRAVAALEQAATGLLGSEFLSR